MSLTGREEHSVTWRELLEEGVCLLRIAGVSEAQLDAWYLLSAAFGLDRAHYYLDQNRPVRKERLEEGYETYRSGLARRAERIPLQQILGSQEFMGLDFYVNEHVLIPRQDTETLVEAVLREYSRRDTAILDMCTGSGCIAVSLAVLGGYRQVTASELSMDALQVAKKNARRHFLIQKGTVRSKAFVLTEKPWRMELKTWVAAEPQEREAGCLDSPGAGSDDARGMHIEERTLTLLQGSLFEHIGQEEMFDVIVSNPPYIPTAVIEELEPEVRDHEPRLALDGAEDGLYFYRVLALDCSRHLKQGGQVFFEIGYDQAEAVSRILAIAGYREIEVIKDAPGLARVVRGRWNRSFKI